MLGNSRGQIAVFVALIFQILFVFFAMTINIGLLIHDKINLQNSVDLAAYYAASKQAEVLNAIGHTNFQIRQSWKLLAFRLRVLGDMGNTRHPMFQNFPNTEIPIGKGQPSTCIAYTYWRGDSSKQNLCKTTTLNIVEIPKSKVIAGWLPFNSQMKNYSEKARAIYSLDCKSSGVPNWALAVKWTAAYRLDVGNRKQVIRNLANLLVGSGAGDFQELDGKSVFQGAKETFERNLTRPNKGTAKAEKPTFEIFNSLGSYQSPVWLRDIQVFPYVGYTDFELHGGGCRAWAKPIWGPGSANMPTYYSDDKSKFDYTGMLATARNEPTSVFEDYHSSVGVEKNPWYMAYVGVKATTKPRKPFAPFGKPITLTARAFAKPFGGRVGPWYGATWPVGSDNSDGNPVDPLLPPRSVFYDETPGPGENDKYTPNYSRFPGDQLGLTSMAALTQFKALLTNPNFALRQYDWYFLPVDLFSPKGDVLAWSDVDAGNNLTGIATQRGPPIRPLELAALAPDLFDITYYSIDTDFEENYRNKAVNILGQGVRLRGDLGTRQEFNINVEDQVTTAKSSSSQNAFWVVKDPAQVLTSWAPSGANEYQFPERVFGKCITVGKVPVPGRCAVGGRTGYSVKIVSKRYLTAKELALGGAPEIKGPIANPPPEDF